MGTPGVASRHQAILWVTGDRVSIRLPFPSANTATRLVATMGRRGGEPMGVWEFELAPSARPGRLLFSPRYLDQGAIVLEHPGSLPTGHFRVGQVVNGISGSELELELSCPANGWHASYVLRWPGQDDLASTLHRWRLQQVSPVEWFYVELTTHCNLRCPFCPSKDLTRSRSFMSLDTARKVFGEIGRYVAQRDVTAGYLKLSRMVFLHVMGEPLLHPQFRECVEIAKQAGLVPALLTNVTLLNERRIDMTLDAGLAHVTLSVNTATPAGYESLGARDAIVDQERRVLHFLRQRAARGNTSLHVDIQYLINDDPYVVGEGFLRDKQEVWQLYLRWHGLVRDQNPTSPEVPGPRPVVDLSLLANPRSEFGSDPSLRFPLDHGIDFVVKSACTFGNAILPDGVEVEMSQHGSCPYHNPYRQMAVFVDGSVSFCNLDHENSVNIGNLLHDTVQDIWTCDRMEQIRDSMRQGLLTEELCQRCLGTPRSIETQTT